MPINKASVEAFEARLDDEYEQRAIASRLEFIQRFPVASLANLTLPQYAIGKGEHTFCSWVEPKTAKWAYIQGATAHKFGIYYGVEKHDPVKKYRVTEIAAAGESNPRKAFRSVKERLLKLMSDAIEMRFRAVDANLISPMFKAKLISLYYPNKYLNICSKEAIDFFAESLGLEDTETYSEMQHRLLLYKTDNRLTRDWSNPKYMLFLHFLFKRNKSLGLVTAHNRRQRHGTVDWEELNRRRALIGRASEDYAIRFEEERLRNDGLGSLVNRIENRCDEPGYGFDFLSFSSPSKRRMIEVKTASGIGRKGKYCFYLSRNEEKVACASSDADYYFYIVFYDQNRTPSSVSMVPATDAFKLCVQTAESYRMTFSERDMRESS